MSLAKLIKTATLSDRWSLGNKFLDNIKSQYYSSEGGELFYVAKVLESGDSVKKSFVRQLGYNPPDGTVRARMIYRNSLYRQEDCPLFFPLLPNTISGVTPTPGSYVLTMTQDIFSLGDLQGNGYWLREITRTDVENLTGESFSTIQEQFGDLEEEEVDRRSKDYSELKFGSYNG